MGRYRNNLLDKVDKKYFYEKLSICDRKTAWIEFYSGIFLVVSIIGSATFASATIKDVVHNFSVDSSLKLFIFWLFLLFFGVIPPLQETLHII
ncbi:MAG: hypothetical protein K0S55_717 [Clostridia bacterium]|jgi:hypothetical protein|nr:hypothetical protein [Clostridia bacterium]